MQSFLNGGAAASASSSARRTVFKPSKNPHSSTKVIHVSKYIQLTAGVCQNCGTDEYKYQFSEYGTKHICHIPPTHITTQATATASENKDKKTCYFIQPSYIYCANCEDTIKISPIKTNEYRTYYNNNQKCPLCDIPHD